MESLSFSSITAQVAGYLRGELVQGRWRGSMPGRNRLAEDLGVSRKTVEGALSMLEDEGVLVGQGPGRRREIMVPPGTAAAATMRIAILHYDAAARRLDYLIDLHHRLVGAGHRVVSPTKTLVDLGMNVSRVRRLVDETETDAWLVTAGSREVLAWFSGRPEPVFALFGRQEGLPVAGTKPNKELAYAVATRHLIELGHRRISLLVRRERRMPEPGRAERAFLGELESHGISPGPYNLPDWDESREGFLVLLESLFRVSPPTALIIDEAPLFVAALKFFAERELRVPGDVSLMCTDGDPTFDWCEPPIAHIRWDSRPVVRRIMRWADNVSRGKVDHRQTLTKAELVVGGTMGPVGEGE